VSAQVRAVLVASGDPDPADARWLAGADIVVAVDAGARWLAGIGHRPEALVGDLDSVDPALVARLEAEGVMVERHPREKDASDTALAIEHALRRGATEIVLLGAFGGDRLDHELANVLLLASSTVARISAVRGGTLVRPLHGGESLRMDGAPGTLVSLLPVAGDADGVTTAGLRYPLDDEPLPLGSTRGLSNEIQDTGASVRLEAGTLLVIETDNEGGAT
jgi:thiamine pyrophosphokinase